MRVSNHEARHAETMPQYIPKYTPPGQAAENRARLRTLLLRTAIAIPMIFLFFVFCYSDQAPAFLRTFVIAVDGALGYPILWLITRIAE